MTASKQEKNIAPDPFDLEANRLGSNPDLDVDREVLSIAVRKPKRTEFFRINPDPAFIYDTYVLERDTGMEKETFWVAPEVKHLVATELRPVRLVTAIDKMDNVFLWPIKLPADATDSIRRIADTALRAAEEAKKFWVKLLWNKATAAYEMARAKGDLGEPTWPEITFKELLEKAFKDKVINSADHVAIRELEGEL